MSAPTQHPDREDRLRRFVQQIMQNVDELEAKTGQGGWYAENIQYMCNAIAKDFGFKGYRDAFAAAEKEPGHG